MGTYLDMVTRIADETLRSDLTDQIKLCIQEAIGHFETERFWFNEFRDRIFTTVAGQEFYGAADLSDIANILDIDALTLSIDGVQYPLARTPFNVLEEMSSNPDVRGRPSCYCHWGQQIRLYPIPEASYPVRIAGLFRLPALAADGDQNPWTNEAESLIRNRAKVILYGQYLRDDANAARASNVEAMAREMLERSTARRSATSSIVPSL